MILIICSYSISQLKLQQFATDVFHNNVKLGKKVSSQAPDNVTYLGL